VAPARKYDAWVASSPRVASRSAPGGGGGVRICFAPRQLKRDFFFFFFFSRARQDKKKKEEKKKKKESDCFLHVGLMIESPPRPKGE
jgi:hypothetical protein